MSRGGTTGLRAALLAGAAIWLLLLIVGFFAPGNWTWGLPGPVGHMMKFMIALWFVILVVVPTLAAVAPERGRQATQIYLLGCLAMLVATVRFDEFVWLSQGSLYVTVLLTAGSVVWAHPDRRSLLVA
ncbi:MAG: hypothetical protein U0821_16970 [Chloroflexota bacterium]